MGTECILESHCLILFEEDLIVVFKGTDMLFKKALVITPAY